MMEEEEEGEKCSSLLFCGCVLLWFCDPLTFDPYLDPLTS